MWSKCRAVGHYDNDHVFAEAYLNLGVLKQRGGGLGYTGPRTSLRGDSSMSGREKSDLERSWVQLFMLPR